MLDDEDLAAVLRAAGPERAATFSWERTAESTASLPGGDAVTRRW